jgi:hypothetical protein
MEWRNVIDNGNSVVKKDVEKLMMGENIQVLVHAPCSFCLDAKRTKRSRRAKKVLKVTPLH